MFHSSKFIAYIDDSKAIIKEFEVKLFNIGSVEGEIGSYALER